MIYCTDLCCRWFPSSSTHQPDSSCHALSSPLANVYTVFEFFLYGSRDPSKVMLSHPHPSDPREPPARNLTCCIRNSPCDDEDEAQKNSQHPSIHHDSRMPHPPFHRSVSLSFRCKHFDGTVVACEPISTHDSREPPVRMCAYDFSNTPCLCLAFPRQLHESSWQDSW